MRHSHRHVDIDVLLRGLDVLNVFVVAVLKRLVSLSVIIQQELFHALSLQRVEIPVVINVPDVGATRNLQSIWLLHLERPLRDDGASVELLGSICVNVDDGESFHDHANWWCKSIFESHDYIQLLQIKIPQRLLDPQGDIVLVDNAIIIMIDGSRGNRWWRQTVLKVISHAFQAGVVELHLSISFGGILEQSIHEELISEQNLRLLHVDASFGPEVSAVKGND